MKTKAAVLYETEKPLRIEEIEIPELKEGQVLVKVLYSGVCHSQLNEIKGLKGNDPYLPHLLGHEGSGIVESLGGGVTKVKQGDYVVMTWIKGSGIDAPSTIYRLNGKNINSGAITTFSERSVISEDRLVKITEKIPGDIAALLGCAVPTGMGMVFNNLEEDPDKTIAVYGVGGVGSSSLIAAKSRGYKQIITIDIHDHKLEKAVELGATHTINARNENVIEAVKRITEGVGVDYAIESSGVKEIMETAFESLRNNGKAIIAGNAKAGTKISIEIAGLNQGKKLLGTWGGETVPDRDIPMYEGLYLERKLPLDKLVTKTYRLEEVNHALDDLKKGELCRGLIKLI